MKADLTDCVTTDSGFLENQIGFLGTHCGYVDQELFPVTTYTMIRTMDLAAVTGERFKNWLKENNVGADQLSRSERMIKFMTKFFLSSHGHLQVALPVSLIFY